MSFDNLVWVGADEMNWPIRHNYPTLFANLIAKRVLFATTGKDSSFWLAVAAELLRHNGHPKDIQNVAIDMSAFCTKGARDNLGNARMVSDKLHVIRNVVEACDQVRKAESRVDEGKPVRLEETPRMWLNNRFS